MTLQAPSIFETRLGVVAHAPAAQDYRLLSLEAPRDLLAACRPGQFFHLLCPASGADAPFLRRPMSIFDADTEAGRLRFLYKVTGAGTRGLATLAVGDRLDVLGPLGRGFDIPRDARLIAVARGVGLATLAPLARAAAERGARLLAICSARSPAHLMALEHFRRLGAEIVTVTDADGDAAPEAVEALIEARIAAQGCDRLYTCGSNRLLKMLQRVAARHAIAGEVALEQQMACGLGMCQCCVRHFRRGSETYTARVCKEGPVFPLDEALEW